MKYLKEKPVKEFKDDDFLKLQAAADSKLIELTVAEELGGQSSSGTFLAEAQDLYKVDAYANNVKNFNKLRADAVEMAFKKMLYGWIKWAPYNNDFSGEDEELWDTSEGIRVLGICYSDDDDNASYGAMINMQGEVSDFIKLSYLTKR